MDLIVDANVLFSALIREGVTSDLFFIEDLHFFTPEFIFEEFRNHREEILRKTHRSDSEFSRLLDVFERRVSTIPLEEIKPHLNEAKEFSPDNEDIPYLALALKLKCGLWSNDKKLKTQDKVRVYSTTDLVKLFTRK